MGEDYNHIARELQRRIAVYDDEHAYKQLFLLLFDTLQRFSFSLLKNRDLAEEVVSDVFIAIWTSRKQLENIDNLVVYLFTSVKYGSLKKLKQINNKKSVSFDDLTVELSTPELPPHLAAEYNDLKNKIQLVVENLPPRTKLVYKLAKEDKLKYKEISTLLNISVKTIDNLLVTALKKIAVALKQPSRNKNLDK